MAAADRMIVAAAVAALVAGAHGKTWCETNFKGFKTGGGELGPPVQADSWDACAEECGKEPRCGWIDWNSETLDCVVKSGQGGAPQMGNGWMCGYCHHAEDPPPPAPQSQCGHEGDPCSLTDLCCTEVSLTCSLGGASPTTGTCDEVSEELLRGIGWSYYFSAALLSAAFLYLVGGSLAGLATGRRGSAALPNASLWAEVGGLVRDGASYSVRGGTGRTEPLIAEGTTLQASMQPSGRPAHVPVRSTALAAGGGGARRADIEKFDNSHDLKAALERQGTAAAKLGLQQLELQEARQLKEELQKLGKSTKGSTAELKARLEEGR